jgi:hypothetical protein
LTCAAAVELLIGHGPWLRRRVGGGDPLAVVWTALEDGHLPCSSGERQILLVAASIAEGVPIDLVRR